MISVILPCYNEADTIVDAVEQVIVLREKLDVEVIVIDDGSTDQSYEKLSTLQGIAVERHQTNRGKGAAIATGAGRATGDVMVIQDADLEYDASVIPALAEPILSGKYDIVYGSRFKGNINGMTLSHFVGNKVLSYCTSLLCGAEVTDMMTGQKAFRTSVFRKLNLGSPRFEFELEVTVEALRNGYLIHEIPIPYSKRQFGDAKIDWTDGFKTMTKLLRYRLGF
jgi:glycosyltransferase involved in cell wall biosynthesis